MYRQMLQIQPRDAHTYYNLSLALDMDGKFPAERQALETAIKLDPTLAQALVASWASWITDVARSPGRCNPELQEGDRTGILS